MNSKTVVPIPAMAFYHPDGFVSAWKQAKRYAGDEGRIGSLPDIVSARLATRPGTIPWEMYFTTITAEYFGVSRKGNLILIVAHGIGPMSTLDGIIKAYAWEFKDKDRNHRGGRITQQEFWDLEAGKFGEVEIVDFNNYCRRYRYPFSQTLRQSEAMTDPVLKARLGPLYEQYIDAHTIYAREWHREQAGIDPKNKYHLPNYDYARFLDRRRSQHLFDQIECSDPYIITLNDAANCCYTFGSEHGYQPIEKGYAIAHLISVGGLIHLWHGDNESLTSDVSCHEWWNGVRLLAVRPNTEFGNIHPGVHDIEGMIDRHWSILMKPVSSPTSVGFRSLVKVGKRWFTQYPKRGECMDTGEAEFLVKKIKSIPGPKTFTTTIGGYPGFLKYGIKEVKTIMPRDANAYYLSGMPTIGGKGHIVGIKFYHVEVDTSQRLMRSDELQNNYEMLMKLIEIEKDTKD